MPWFTNSNQLIRIITERPIQHNTHKKGENPHTNMKKTKTKTKKKANPVGRPPLCLTDEQRKIAQALLEIGSTRDEVCAVLGFSRETYRKLQQRDPLFAAAVKQGRAKAQATIRKKLFHHLNSTDNRVSLDANKFLAKAYLNEEFGDTRHMTLKVEQMSDEELKKAVAQLLLEEASDLSDQSDEDLSDSDD